MKSVSKIALCAAVLLAPALVGAQVYKWVDANGKVQFSDQPPPNSKAQALKLPSNNVSAPPASKAASKQDDDATVTPEVAQTNCDALTRHLDNYMADSVKEKPSQSAEYEKYRAQVKAQVEKYRQEQEYWCSKTAPAGRR
ncbi:DUF4124 domain-containing protein [Chitinimonas sp.]|uniref:DUF4124 domain-containing protein n=1 Tax=Chitinimonas sp. TaxID=1934313 RepID=UPI002F954A01